MSLAVKLSLGILVSGRGSNMAAILQSIKEGRLDARVAVVLSNNPQAQALETAREYGVPAVAIASKGLPREEHERLVLDELFRYELDFVVLAGYMRVLSPLFLQAFADPAGYYRVINIHPSLLPAFPGASGYEDAFAANVPLSGVTVHLVDEKVDHGPILAQRSFAREAGDTLESFKARGLAIEHQIYPAVLQELACGGIELAAPYQGVRAQPRFPCTNSLATCMEKRTP